MNCITCLNQAIVGQAQCFDCQTLKTTHPVIIGLGLGMDPAAAAKEQQRLDPSRGRASDRSLDNLYPKYYKVIPSDWKVIDVYGVCKLFPVADDSGCINHATKKLLVPGVRTGGKTMYQDVKEARDSLNRWLQLNPE